MAIEQHRTVHLARQADAAHTREGGRMRAAQLRDRRFGRGPPVGRILFGPQGLGTAQRQPRARGPDDLAVLVEQQDLDFGGPQIDAEEHQAASSCTGSRPLMNQPPIGARVRR